MTVDELKKIMKLVFSNSIIPEDITNLEIGDIEEWDSLGNLNLLLAIESEISTRFTIDQISEIKSVSQILRLFSKEN